ncbi:MAG: PAS domain S-box protein [Candidatus Eisenbacteria bacterium]|nr:PAS domain S-box protein [Candidatus Eisenbacteria bacterium]
MPSLHPEIQHQMAVLETLIAHAPVGVAFVDADTRFVHANQAMADIHGLTPHDMVGRTVAEVQPEMWARIEPYFRSAMRGEALRDEEVLAPPGADGLPRVFLASHYPIEVEGTIAGVGVLVKDVTESRRIEHDLRLRNDLYSMLSRTNRAVSRCRTAEELYRQVCEIAVDVGGYLHAFFAEPDYPNVRIAAMAGSDAGIPANTVISLDEDDPRSKGPTSIALRTGEVVVVNDFRTALSTTPWRGLAERAGVGAALTLPIRMGDKIVAAFSLYSPLTGFFTPELLAGLAEIAPTISFALERYEQERVRQSDELALRQRDRAINAASQGIVVTDATAEGQPIVFVSPGFEQMTGYSAQESIGRNCRFLSGPATDPAARGALRDAVKAGRNCSVELLNYRKDGTTFWNQLAVSAVRDDAGRLTHFVGVQTDVTERRRLQEQLQQAQKMEAIGQLAGGVSHDFNNLLVVILGCSELLLEREDLDDDARQLLRDIQAAAERSATLTRQLLAFSRKQVWSPVVLDLNHVVHDIEKMLRRLIGEDVRLRTDLGARSPMVKCDPGQIHQVLLNLAVNARDAMPLGGSLTIRTREVLRRDLSPRAEAGLPTDRFVELEVADTGSGMTSEVRERLFEPFFTTKEHGKGTGLGLAVVHGVVRQCGGFIEVASGPGLGTSFHVFLPHAERSAHALGPVEDGAPPAALGETILFVEDDDGVRSLIEMVFREQGYRVLTASSGAQALELLDAHSGTLDLLVSDVVMPGMGGRELVTLVHEKRPGLRFLYLSGYTDDSIVRQGISRAEVNFLQKPFSAGVLLRKVREVLES